ncbi:MAG TPA: electron-transfer flavoprotein:ubiquinone oxidoreductase [Patescibacteria group bacterium]|nr:electron-transfer flavoprotein:ubiquinone oxidoreductase [Patescibacteria group bacterium]
MTEPLDVLVVGGGPAGLATAIRLKQQLAATGRDASVAVIDKSPHPGYHALSGAAFEAACLDELVPGWRDDRRFMEHVVPVQRDELYFLAGPLVVRVPPFVVPGRMHHTGDVTLSLSRLVDFLATKAEKLGVELYHGFSARTLLLDEGRVAGVGLTDLGRNNHGGEKSNFRPAEEIRARLTVLADGSRGVISNQFRETFGSGRNPQVYSLGIKAVVQFTGENPFGNHRVIHTLGYPNPASVFGGGFIYSMGETTAAVGLILGLDWRHGDLNPQREFERYRAHPFIAKLLAGSVTIATGAKTIPEGGYFALGALTAAGALVVGDGAGFVNMEQIKGIHHGIHSGMAAADTIVDALAAGDTSKAALAGYRTRLEARGVLPGLRHARNYRAAFRRGIYLGTPISLISSRLPGRLGMEPDSRGTKKGARLDRPDPEGMDGATFVSLTGSVHREDEPAHMTILDPTRCLTCEADYANSCTHFCPGQVYRWDGAKIVLSASNCLHCMTCAVKCPLENIRWLPPEGGEGPRFTQM